MTVVDTHDAPTSSAPPTRAGTVSGPRNLDLESAVLKIIEQDPFASIGEIKFEINHRSNDLNTTWWQVFRLLKRNKLLTKRSRFKYILGRR